MILTLPKNRVTSTGDILNYRGNKYRVLNFVQKEKFNEVEVVDVPFDTEELDSIVATVNGKVFAVDDVSQSRIHRAIELSKVLGVTATQWKLAQPFNGELVTTVTVAELTQALAIGMRELGSRVLR